ncbi:MAG: pyridoxal phosphate-dependent aminotransferase [Polyangiaceae bacterium]|nr:pyridoxal phosphate-dependent aminotransferase [Polyangiaceae bacterium]
MNTTSRRANWDLSPNALTIAYTNRVRSGLDVLDLIQSNPTIVGINPIDQRVLDALANEACQKYEPTARGLPNAREAVASWYRRNGIAMHADQLLLTASSSESYAMLLKLLCDPGDSIVVPAPSYPLFDHLARLECVGVDRYPLMEDDGFRIDELALRESIGSTAKAIFLVSPNNPTGSFLHEQELRCVERVAKDYGLSLVCDEVFAEYIWKDSEDRVRCAAMDAAVPTFSLGGLSKSACMPQMKLGWIVMGGGVSDDTICRLEMIADTYLSVSTPIQHASAALLSCADVARRQMSERIRVNLAVLRDAVSGTSMSLLDVHGGWYGCLRVPSVMTDEQWAVKLVEEDGVMVHPGSYFGFSRAGVLVVGLIAPCAEFAEGICRLVEREEYTVRK